MAAEVSGKPVPPEDVADFMGRYTKANQLADQEQFYRDHGLRSLPPPRDGCEFRSRRICDEFKKNFKGALLGQLAVYKKPDSSSLSYPGDKGKAADGSRVAWGHHVVPFFMGTDRQPYVIDPFLDEKQPTKLRDFMQNIAHDSRGVDVALYNTNRYAPRRDCIDQKTLADFSLREVVCSPGVMATLALAAAFGVSYYTSGTQPGAAAAAVAPAQQTLQSSPSVGLGPRGRGARGRRRL